MSGDAMPREQQAFIDEVYQFVSDATNMTKDEAKDFSFRVWQIQRFLRTALTPWISIKDRLPERKITNSERVFAWTNVGGMTMQYDHDREIWFVSPAILRNILSDGSIVVTHWAPLPEPPGGEVEE